MAARSYDQGFYDGYQEAMYDAAQAYEREGIDGMRTWVFNNLSAATMDKMVKEEGKRHDG